jgi:methylmalonyl-CoA mutase
MSLFANDLKSQPELSRWLRSSASISGEQIKTVTADVYGFHNQNCLAYYEVALAMCILLEYIHCFGGEKIQLPASAFVIRTGVSSDYFIQMAKLRAMRRLWRVLAKELGAGNELHIIAGTSLCNKSVSDSYNNLLRSSIEAMAAVAGGCDELMVNPLDVFLPGKTELADRMAINQQLILKDEVYMDKMADISCGSYFIETITDHIAEKALEAVKQIEKAGGFFKALENGDIRAEIARQSKERASLVNSGEQVAVGVNKFRNEKEQTKFDPKILETLKDQKIENPFITYEMEKLNTTKHA